MKTIKKIFNKVSIVTLMVAPFSSVYAAETSAAKLKTPIGFTSFGAIVGAIVDVVVKVGTLLVIMAIIYAGFLFVTAQGSPDKISKAKATFLWVIIGSVILLGADQLSEVVQNTAGQFK